MSSSQPRVLLLSYTYTGQSARVAQVMAEVLRARGFAVEVAAIEFTDPRYTQRFSRFPLRHAYLDVFRMLVPQLRCATGGIRVPDGVGDADYDLVCLGSPAWWLTTSMPMRSFLESEAGRILAGPGETRGRYLGVPLPPSNLQRGFEAQARGFAGGLADAVAPVSSDPHEVIAPAVGEGQGIRQSPMDHGGK